jgi:hypothetical protein
MIKLKKSIKKGKKTQVNKINIKLIIQVMRLR